jgi:hypothetical protein
VERADGDREGLASSGKCKPLALFNLADEEAYVGAELSLLGLSGSLTARDLWAREETGEVSGRIGCSLPPHGAAVFALR